MIDPETDPAEHHDQYTWQICLKNEITDVPLELEAQRKPLVDAGRQLLLPIVGLVADYRELRQFRLLDSANGGFLPVHYYVEHRVPV